MRSAIFIKGRRGNLGFAVIIVFRNERTQGPQMLRAAQSAGVRYLWTMLRQIIDEVGGAISPPKLHICASMFRRPEILLIVLHSRWLCRLYFVN